MSSNAYAVNTEESNYTSKIVSYDFTSSTVAPDSKQPDALRSHISIADTQCYMANLLTSDYKKPSSRSDSLPLDSIASYRKSLYEEKIQPLYNEIYNIILHDEFFDGQISKSEIYMMELCSTHEMNIILDTLMRIYISSLLESHVLEGILRMISSVSYESVEPNGQIIAMGLLSNRELSIRDTAIQCFEKWNSKKGLLCLKSLQCHPAWLQKYVDKVIFYIEKDGIE